MARDSLGAAGPSLGRLRAVEFERIIWQKNTKSTDGKQRRDVIEHSRLYTVSAQGVSSAAGSFARFSQWCRHRSNSKWPGRIRTGPCQRHAFSRLRLDCGQDLA